MACGCQVQGHGDVEGQCEDWEVPLAEDGAQGTGQDGAGGRDMGNLSALACFGIDHTVTENPGSPRDKQLPGCRCLGFFLEWDTETGEGSHSASEGWL